MPDNHYRCRILDSHRNMPQRTCAALADFFREVKSLSPGDALEQVRFCDWYERETAVKWMEVAAWEAGRVVGYLRCLRNPVDDRQWFIGDVHVRAAYRQRGIATKMYEKIIAAVMEYEAAECIVASVHPENGNSIALHEKMSFQNTGEPCRFPDFYFDPKETEYRKYLYQHFPVPNSEEAVEQLLPLWMEYLRDKGQAEEEKKAKRELKSILRKAEEGEAILESLWCGRRLVGFQGAAGEPFGSFSFLRKR